jgi:hypothetical protein
MSVIEANFSDEAEADADAFDHRLPLVLLRERRRELVMEMRARGPKLSTVLITKSPRSSRPSRLSKL